MNGVVYIAYGDRAKREAALSIESLKRHNDLPVTVIKHSFFNDDQFRTDEQKSRWAKVNLPQLVDYDRVLYIDADTLVKGDITPGFDLLDNWDLAIAPSKNQGNDLFAHIKNEEEKEATLREIGNWQPVQLQAGLFFFSCERCAGLFAEWRRQWQRWNGQDQAALLRALDKCPVRVWLLSKQWNGENGTIVQHLFGRV